ncbi:hypothetical protein HG530_015436 [Fusarium avenaceum]|nr:hypothetical protein HG530_015436 [Fusarium avenaceum]
MAILLLEPLVQTIDRLLDMVHQLVLVLLNGATNLRAHEKGIELGKDSEHLVRGLGGSQSLSKSADDRVFYTGRTLVVEVLGSYPSFLALVRNIQKVNILKSLPSLLDLLNSIDVANLFNNDTVRFSSLSNARNSCLRTENSDDCALKLLMVVAEGADIFDSRLKLRVLLDYLDRYKLFVAASSHLAGHISKFLHILLPGLENMITCLHDVLELLVIQIDQLGTRQKSVKHIIEIS